MIRHLLFTTSVLLFLISCTNSTATRKVEPGTTENQVLKTDTSGTTIVISGAKKPTVENGENIEYYENGAVKIRGMMKNGQRDGTWKSWYEDGSPWSETNFIEGKKSGKTTTWYKNGKKRYDGFYTNNIESGNWMIWDENGKLTETKNYDKK